MEYLQKFGLAEAKLLQFQQEFKRGLNLYENSHVSKPLQKSSRKQDSLPGTSGLSYVPG